MRLTVLPRLRDRVFSDFLMRSRLGAYRRLLEAALRAGQISSVGIVWRLIGDSGLDPTQCNLVLRHDVDTEPRTADAMRRIGRGLSVGDSAAFGCS